MSEPTLGDVQKELREGLEVDKRLRYVETKQAEMGAIVTQLDKALPAMEQRLLQAIEASRPKNAAMWAAVGVAGLAVVLTPILTVLMTR